MAGQFTGRRMAAVLVAGFGVVVAVNFTMAALASSTFGGLVVENSYVASQRFNGWLADAKEADALGWKAAISRGSDGRVQVATRGVPADAKVTGVAWHPLGKTADRQLEFARSGTGTYLSSAPLAAGRWLVRLEISDEAKIWRGEQALP